MFGFRRLATSVVKNTRNAHKLPELPYEYEALEPIISRDIMALHHDKHHRAYVVNLNSAEDKLRAAFEKNDFSAVVGLAPTLRFNGGGHINHSIFWNNLSPHSSQPSSDLCTAIKYTFGSFTKFQQSFSAQTVGIQGSGWGWLAYDPKTGNITTITMANQDPLQAITGLIPLLGIDVWEHAYYLQYQNNRAAYLKAIFDIINWKDVNERYAKAMASRPS